MLKQDVVNAHAHHDAVVQHHAMLFHIMLFTLSPLRH